LFFFFSEAQEAAFLVAVSLLKKKVLIFGERGDR